MPQADHRTPSVLRPAEIQRTRSQREQSKDQRGDLLFSGLVELIARVVTRVVRSVLKSYESLKEVLGVSDEAVYQKLLGIETCVSQALVRDSFREASAVLAKLGVAEMSWVRGRRVKILDGNHLQASEHRIAELRAIGMLRCRGRRWWCGISRRG